MGSIPCKTGLKSINIPPDLQNKEKKYMIISTDAENTFNKSLTHSY